MLKGPFKEIKLSVRERVAVPYSSLSMFPRSPTCLTESEGAPWVLPYGLKCVPVDIHPLLRSPRELLVEFKYPTQFNILDYCSLNMEATERRRVEILDFS